MACAGSGFVFIHSGIGFIWRAIRESTFSIHFNFSSTSKCHNRESFFFARTPGFTNSDNNP